MQIFNSAVTTKATLARPRFVQKNIDIDRFITSAYFGLKVIMILKLTEACVISAYAKVRETFGSDVWVILDAAGRGLEDFQDQYLEPDYQSLNIDTHLYQVRGSYSVSVPKS